MTKKSLDQETLTDKPFPLETLPKDLLQYAFPPHLKLSDMVKLSVCSKHMYGIFKKPIQTVKTIRTKHLFFYILNADYVSAKRFLQYHLPLMFEKVHSKKEKENDPMAIARSPLQFAANRLDIYMCKLFYEQLKGKPEYKKKFVEQLNQVETFVDIEPLETAYKKFFTEMDKLKEQLSDGDSDQDDAASELEEQLSDGDSDQDDAASERIDKAIDEAWVKIVGSAQYSFFRGARSFFKEMFRFGNKWDTCNFNTTGLQPNNQMVAYHMQDEGWFYCNFENTVLKPHNKKAVYNLAEEKCLLRKCADPDEVSVTQDVADSKKVYALGLHYALVRGNSPECWITSRVSGQEISVRDCAKMDLEKLLKLHRVRLEELSTLKKELEQELKIECPPSPRGLKKAVE